MVALTGRALQERQRIRAEAAESVRHIWEGFSLGTVECVRGRKAQEFRVCRVASGRRVRWSSSVLLGRVVTNGAAVALVVTEGELQGADHRDALMVLVGSCLGLTASKQSVVLLV